MLVLRLILRSISLKSVPLILQMRLPPGTGGSALTQGSEAKPANPDFEGCWENIRAIPQTASSRGVSVQGTEILNLGPGLMFQFLIRMHCVVEPLQVTFLRPDPSVKRTNPLEKSEHHMSSACQPFLYSCGSKRSPWGILQRLAPCLLGVRRVRQTW